MIKLILPLFLLFSLKIAAQVNEEVLADTTTFMLAEINALESNEYDQKIYRLNFEDCNLEYERLYKSNESDWLMYDVWLYDIDEKKMRLDYEEGEWQLKLVSTDKKIEMVSSRNSGYTIEMTIHSKEKEPLLAIGKALYFAIKSCKMLNE